MAILISIHVPRWGDDQNDSEERKMAYISIHVPRMGDDSKYDEKGA